MTWKRLQFRLLGDMHAGERKWGFVRSGRAYLPGWTLWGALTNLLKRSGKRPGSFEQVGNWLNENFWIGHLALTTVIQNGGESRSLGLLPAPGAGGKMRFQWALLQHGEPSTLSPGISPPQPMSYRHGVVRQPSPDAQNLGNLFLTETLSGPWLQPFLLEGWIQACGSEEIPLSRGDIMAIGGNRTASRPLLIFEAAGEETGDEAFPRSEYMACLTHLNHRNSAHVAGAQERIVLRRTIEGSGKGFGGSMVDWGIHLKPGWIPLDGNMAIRPVRIEGSGWRHGTVEPVG